MVAVPQPASQWLGQTPLEGKQRMHHHQTPYKQK
jgi:hypothetical protein